MTAKRKLVIMVSSTVYGIEELLDRIYTLLTSFGYEVWMSHKGTVPVFPYRSNFENCIMAVEKCDLFLALITTHYGSGQEDKASLSITHREMLKAIALNKPRWVLSHDHVVFARSLLDSLGYRDKTARRKLKLKENPVFGDLRVIDMYEDTAVSKKALRDRRGNWVQKFETDEDALLYAAAQFSRYQEVEAFIDANFKRADRISRTIAPKARLR